MKKAVNNSNMAMCLTHGVWFCFEKTLTCKIRIRLVGQLHQHMNLSWEYIGRIHSKTTY